ncbi:MAG: nitronate monooxygenase, partial [Gaiellaceae bacterium]
MTLALRTPLCRDLGIEYPILSAGIGSAAGAELVSAVSNAGGFGVLGVSGMQPEEIRRLIGRTRELTKRPFGANVIIDEEGWATTDDDKQLLRDEVATAADEGVGAVVLFWGDPTPYVDEVHGK